MSLTTLVEKLSPTATVSLEAAASLCNSRSHSSVEIQHWLLAMCQQSSSDLLVVCEQYEVNVDRLVFALNQDLESLKSGHDSAPSLSKQLVSLIESAWVSSTLAFGETAIEPIHVIHALLSDESLIPFTPGYLQKLSVIDPGELVKNWQGSHTGSDLSLKDTSLLSATSSSPNLEQFTVDLTQIAKEGGLDPILGRDDEIRQIIDVLMRRRQNNPILTGEAGVGKTAVVEGFAQRIAKGDVPESLRDVRVLSLDLALLQAGAGVKGEFENRLKNVIKEVKASVAPIVIFIDEAHSLIGSGGGSGQNDAANILKPALARGELRTIAATTWAEYKKYFEKDAALTRRFQVVKVEEPSEELAITMLRGLLPVMEAHHNVAITDEALQAAVKLSSRYINGRQLPDKAVALLDTACARVAISQVATPANVECLDRQYDALIAERSLLEQEQATGSNHSGKIAVLTEQLDEVSKQRKLANANWQWQREQLESAIALKHQILSAADTDVTDVCQQLTEVKASLNEFEQSMVHLEVDENLVAQVISDWTGIPLGRMRVDQLAALRALTPRLQQRIIGQDHALDRISQVVKTARMKLSDENKPDGVFLLTGPSGTGKTETALALAQQIYGSDDSVTVINMSEFKEEHKVSLLLGSPPGYVGYGEGGVLTEAVRRKPYSVILLDEMEKAHPSVQDVFYQIFDKGIIKDGEGTDIDFKNCIIIITSNVGSETTENLFEDRETAPGAEGLTEALQNDLLEAFKPAFLGRLNIIPYVPLSQSDIEAITKLQLDRVANRYREHYQADLTFDESVILHINKTTNNVGVGARAIQLHIQNVLLPFLSELLMERLVEEKDMPAIQLSIEGDTYVSVNT
uniref:type VI secretion system ATPase TssH n=1 Tax=Vibrio sp. 10N TaxID=3058938 RepID=UPI0030C6D4F2